MERDWMMGEKREKSFSNEESIMENAGFNREIADIEPPKEKITAKRHFFRHFVAFYCTLFFGLSVFHLARTNAQYKNIGLLTGTIILLLGYFISDRVCSPYDVKIELSKEIKKKMKPTVIGFAIVLYIIQTFFFDDITKGIYFCVFFSLLAGLAIITTYYIQEDLLKDYYDFK